MGDDTRPDPESDATTDGGARRAAEAQAIADGNPSVAVIGDDTTSDDTTTSPDFDVVTDLTAHKWGRFFPFDEPYPQQVDGIETAVELLADDGYLLAEGACGTGKTMMALNAGLHAVFDPHHIEENTGNLPAFSTIFAVTSVKQQLKQFVADLRTINEHYNDAPAMDGPIGGVVLRGKGDLVPYARENRGPYGSNTGGSASGDGLDDGSKSTHEASEDIRENTSQIIKRGSAFPINWGATDIDPPDESRANTPTPDDDDKPWYDEHRAKAVVQLCENLDGARLETAGVKAPYPEETPSASDIVRERSGISGNPVPSDYLGHVDPFYAKYFAADELPIQFSDADNYVLDGDALIETGVKRGVSPHACLGDLLEEATVVIGNYYHLFDEDTRMLADDIIDERTLAIVDEAHMLEERLRDSLSQTLSIYDVRRAANDLGKVADVLEGRLDSSVYDKARDASDGDFMDSLSELREEHASIYKQIQHGTANYSVEDVREAQKFLRWVEGAIKAEATEYFNDEYPRYSGDPRGAKSDNNISEFEPQVPLQEPDEHDMDTVLERFTDFGKFDDEVWEIIGALGKEISQYMEDDEYLDRTPTVGEVGEFLFRWRHESHVGYFRELQLDYSPKDAPMPGFSDAPWTEVFNAELSLYNCIPSDQLAQYFDELGGGILMSATIQPFDIFESVAGLSAIENGEIPLFNETKDTVPRPVESVQYGLLFPEENRASHIVTAEPFTSNNRGYTTHDTGEMSSTRETYRDIIIDVGASHGNTLLCMPAYYEAEWAGEELEAAPGITKEVIVDKSTSAEETSEMLDDFFETDEHQILVTSALGTVTEGIDYDGEKLHCCAVIGVPYPRMDDKRTAIESAFEERFDMDGFDAGVKAPTIRKARQAIGRVIRGHDEEGVRLFVDERYASGGWSVNEFLSEQEQQEFTPVSPRDLNKTLAQFWDE